EWIQDTLRAGLSDHGLCPLSGESSAVPEPSMHGQLHVVDEGGGVVVPRHRCREFQRQGGLSHGQVLQRSAGCVSETAYGDPLTTNRRPRRACSHLMYLIM